jgi:hypothetical protein
VSRDDGPWTSNNKGSHDLIIRKSENSNHSQPAISLSERQITFGMGSPLGLATGLLYVNWDKDSVLAVFA